MNSDFFNVVLLCEFQSNKGKFKPGDEKGCQVNSTNNTVQ
jgi:hypothetical protein